MTAEPGPVKKILITGATGFIGSFLVDALLDRGNEVVCLARPCTGRPATASERVKHALTRINPVGNLSRLRVLTADITKGFAGVPSGARDQLRGTIDEIWHCAADTRLIVPRSHTLLANVTATEEMLALATDLRVPRFQLISTAYVFQDRPEVAHEVPVDRRTRWRNAYEESKNESEDRLLCHVAATGMAASIFRLPVTTGHSLTGVTSQFLGYYSLAKALADLRRIVPNQLISDRRTLLRIICPPGATINILPVDVIVRTLLDCASRAVGSMDIYHVTNGTPPTIKFLYETTLDHLGQHGVVIEDGDEPSIIVGTAFSGHAAVEQLMRRSMKCYFPYLKGDPVFSRANLQRTLGCIPLPDFAVDRPYIKCLLDYAMTRDWGTKDEVD